MTDLLAAMTLAATLALCAVLAAPARADALPKTDAPARAAPGMLRVAAKPAHATPSRASSPYRTTGMPDRAREYYLSVWGVDNLLARATASGSLIRFSYRVVDPARAKLLGDKRATPYMYGLRSHALLQVPVMEQVGPMRQSSPPNARQEYWIVFSNKENFVRPGDRVNVIIGPVHVDGLLVQ